MPVHAAFGVLQGDPGVEPGRRAGILAAPGPVIEVMYAITMERGGARRGGRRCDQGKREGDHRHRQDGDQAPTAMQASKASLPEWKRVTHAGEKSLLGSRCLLHLD